MARHSMDLRRSPGVPEVVAGVLSRGKASSITKFASYDFPSRPANFLLDVSFPGRRSSNREGSFTAADGTDGLQEVLSMACVLQCQDPRNRIYSTLAMVDWEGTDPIVQDYSKTRLEIGISVL